MKPRIDWWQVLVVVGLLGGAVLLAAGEGGHEALPVDVMAPNFIAKRLDGRTASLTSGQMTVVAFWASWCEPCRRELPVILGVLAERPNVELLALNLDEPSEQEQAVAGFVESLPALAPHVVLGTTGHRRAMAGDGPAELAGRRWLWPGALLTRRRGVRGRAQSLARPLIIYACQVSSAAALEATPLHRGA